MYLISFFCTRKTCSYIYANISSFSELHEKISHIKDILNQRVAREMIHFKNHLASYLKYS
jgi:hypothetical protein